MGPLEFQSTRPARGATQRLFCLLTLCLVSIHAPRAGRDAKSAGVRSGRVLFQSTRPARGATLAHLLSPHPHIVSIHAPRAGRDSRPAAQIRGPSCFNPRAPRGARPGRFRAVHDSRCFNPRAPRGARPIPRCWTSTPASFNPRAPRGARRPAEFIQPHIAGFNPRAPRGARLFWTGAPPSGDLFQSTRPARGATPESMCWRRCKNVSIHAPRAGRDVARTPGARRHRSFNPRAPRGARPSNPHQTSAGRSFQSTRPARGATRSFVPKVPATAVSIHAPRAGRDAKIVLMVGFPHQFQSTRPARGATPDLTTGNKGVTFQSTRPARGATRPSTLKKGRW